MSATAPKGALRQTLEDAFAESRCGLGALMVLAKTNGPFRVDTEARHCDGAWLAAEFLRTLIQLGDPDRSRATAALLHLLDVRRSPEAA